MKKSVAITVLIAAASLPAAAQVTKPLTPSQMVAPQILVARIDTNCSVVRDAIKSQQPTRVVRSSTSLWKLASAGDATVADKAGTIHSMAEVWKQAGNYQWAHVVSVDAHGNRRATQLCYRADGTLARVRQGTTVPALGDAVSSVAYFNTDGSVIRKSATFAVDDPAVVKRMDAQPFFKILPR